MHKAIIIMITFMCQLSRADREKRTSAKGPLAFRTVGRKPHGSHLTAAVSSVVRVGYGKWGRGFLFHFVCFCCHKIRERPLQRQSMMVSCRVRVCALFSELVGGEVGL
uniref:Putative secreted protein n=1 Tax=Anopheles darlingi TaxID=43151 RepID=A0A2M4DBY8_ANODA